MICRTLRLVRPSHLGLLCKLGSPILYTRLSLPFLSGRRDDMTDSPDQSSILWN